MLEERPLIDNPASKSLFQIDIPELNVSIKSLVAHLELDGEFILLRVIENEDGVVAKVLTQLAELETVTIDVKLFNRNGDLRTQTYYPNFVFSNTNYSLSWDATNENLVYDLIFVGAESLEV